ncbi:MAG: cation:proton antiporter [Dehalococcoidia bacterium]
MQDTTLLLNLAAALAVAGVSAAIAARLGQSVILGYLLAGVAIGANTPGFTADPGTVGQLADVGVILLMFAIGIQIAPRDLFATGRTTLVGAHVQIALIILIGFGVAIAVGWRWEAALFFGAVLSNSSSTVLTKVLGERGQEGSTHGQLALAWSTVQDLNSVVLVVALVAVTTEGGNIAGELALATLKAALFLAFLVPVGSRVLPDAFAWLARLGSRELFILMAAALALGAAYVATLLGLSPALGAFIAGIALSESEVRDEIFHGVVPIRDVFAGLFFVSVGMLVDPMIFIDQAGLTLLSLALIVLAKGAICVVLVRLFRYPWRTALLTGVALAQCAEFSFLIARVGSDMDVLSGDEFSLLLGSAALSIVVAPGLLRAAEPLATRLARMSSPRGGLAQVPDRTARGHVILCGYGRVGRLVANGLREHGVEFAVIDQDARVIAALRSEGDAAYLGTADNALVLERAGIREAQMLVLAIPERLGTRVAAQYARQLNPGIVLVARSHSDAEQTALEQSGVNDAVNGEQELALAIVRYALGHRGVADTHVEETVRTLRQGQGVHTSTQSVSA